MSLLDCTDIHSALISEGEVMCFVCNEELIDTHTTRKNIEECQGCRSTTLIKDGGYIVCSKCGLVSDTPVYTFSYLDFDRCTIRKKYCYKREGNFSVILDQFLCRHDQKVPDEVVETLWNQINNRDNILYNYTIPLSIPILECLLKKNKLMSYKKSIFYIYFTLTNQPFPHMTQHERNRAWRIFNVASRVYDKHKPDGRISFLNYYFVLKKIFTVIGKNNYAKYVPGLKSLTRQHELERIWSLITKDPRWVEGLREQGIVLGQT